MAIDYRTLSLAEIAADLSDTLEDLYINAGESHLAALLEKLHSVRITDRALPSERLIEIMQAALAAEPDQLSAPVQALFRDATDEIIRLATTAE